MALIFAVLVWDAKWLLNTFEPNLLMLPRLLAWVWAVPAFPGFVIGIWQQRGRRAAIVVALGMILAFAVDGTRVFDEYGTFLAGLFNLLVFVVIFVATMLFAGLLDGLLADESE